MAGNIQTGYAFNNTEQVTGDKINLAINASSLSNVNQINAAAGLITVSTTAPSAGSGFGWFDISAGAGRGILRVYDNGIWRPVAEGFVGYNNGLTVARGAPVVYDATFATGVSVGQVPFRKTNAPTSGAVQMDRAIGVAAESIVNAITGVILTRGYATAIKDASTVTAGDPLVPSITTNAQATTGALGSWGYPEGSAFGRWLNTSSAAAGTEVPVFLTGSQRSSWVAFKNSGGTAVFTNAAPGVAGDNDKWSGSFATPQFGTFATAPIGTIARVCQCLITQVTDAAATVARLAFGLRAKNATITLDTGAAFAGGLFHARGAGTITGQAFRCQLNVQETTAASSNQCEFYIETGGTVTGLRVSVTEVGVIVGGQVV